MTAMLRGLNGDGSVDVSVIIVGTHDAQRMISFGDRRKRKGTAVFIDGCVDGASQQENYDTAEITRLFQNDGTGDRSRGFKRVVNPVDVVPGGAVDGILHATGTVPFGTDRVVSVGRYGEGVLSVIIG